MTLPPGFERCSCPLCGSSDERVMLTARDELYGADGEFVVVRCAHCSLIRTNPRPDRSTIGRYYPETYSPHLTSAVGVTASAPRRGSSRQAQGWRHALRGLIRYQTEAVPPLRPGRMLEIGCASGAFMREMQKSGWTVEGLEFSEVAAERACAAGLHVRVGSVDEAVFEADSYDLVVGWMVLEHLHDPVNALRHIRSWARPEAWLCLSVPDASAMEFSLFGRYWYALQVPTHLTHFTPTTLCAVLEAAGWHVEKVLHHRTLGNLIGSLGLAMRAARLPQRWCEPLIRFPERSTRWSIAFYPIAWLLSVLGQTGRMTIWARKA